MGSREDNGSNVAIPDHGDLEIKGLVFRHSEISEFRLIVDNANFPYDKCVAIIDPSGSGKSTLFDLLQRFIR